VELTEKELRLSSSSAATASQTLFLGVPTFSKPGTDSTERVGGVIMLSITTDSPVLFTGSYRGEPDIEVSVVDIFHPSERSLPEHLGYESEGFGASLSSIPLSDDFSGFASDHRFADSRALVVGVPNAQSMHTNVLASDPAELIYGSGYGAGAISIILWGPGGRSRPRPYGPVHAGTSNPQNGSPSGENDAGSCANGIPMPYIIATGKIGIGTDNGFPVSLSQDGAALGASVAILEERKIGSGTGTCSGVRSARTSATHGCVPGITIAAGAPGLDGGRGAVVLAIIIPMQYVSPTLAQ